MAKATFPETTGQESLKPTSTISDSDLRNAISALFQMDLSPLRAKAQSTPNMTVQVNPAEDNSFNAHVWKDSAQPMTYAGGNSSAITAPTSNPRIDILVLQSNGTLAWVTGAENASPVPNWASIPAQSIPICLVYCKTTMDRILAYDDKDSDTTEGYVYKDIRPFLNLGGGTFQTLSDTPASYTGKAGYVPIVNLAETALEFYNLNKTKDDIALLAFRMATADGLSLQGMVDGFVDEYEDQTGVDTGGSSNYQYDSTDDFYTNKIIGSTASFDSYGSSNQSADYLLIADGTYWEELGQCITISSAINITSIKFWLKRGGTPPAGNVVCRIYATTGTVGSTAKPTGSVLATSNNVTASGIGTSYAWYEFTFATPYSASAQGYCFVLYWGGTDYGAYPVAGYDNTSPTHGGNLARRHGSGGAWEARSGEDLIFDIYGYTTSIGNMTLKSAAQTALTAPSTARIVLFEQDVVSITINTDLTASVSRDGGTTWTQATLVDKGDYESGRQILAASVDISGQPSGTSMKYKIVTANNKELKIHGVALAWD